MKLFKKKSGDAQVITNNRRYILNEKSNFAVTEAYKTLRTNVYFYLRGEECKKLCLTSDGAGEGKSITALNLSISFAQTGKRVLLLEADMRRPSIGRLLKQKSVPGLSDMLAGLAEAKDAVRKEVFPGLDILFAGEIPPNPSELLQSKEMDALLQKFSESYDYIIVDTPPLGIVTDASIVSSKTDGTLMVVRQNFAKRTAIGKNIKQLEIAGANIIGFVYNGQLRRAVGGRYHYYKYELR